MSQLATTNQSLTQANEQVEQIRLAHVEAQQLADNSLKASAQAIQLAHSIGSKLAAIRKSIGGDYQLWCENHFGEEFANKWSGRYIRCSQLELNFNSTDTMREGMKALELLPHKEREDLGDDHRRREAQAFDQKLIKSINSMMVMVKQIEDRKSYKIQFSELYRWLEREMFANNT